jgi:hypothetical protein
MSTDLGNYLNWHVILKDRHTRCLRHITTFPLRAEETSISPMTTSCVCGLKYTLD